MSNYNDLFQFAEPEKEAKASLEIDVAFCCQHCDDLVQTARHFVNDGVVVWTCDQGHKSIMEGFYL